MSNNGNNGNNGDRNYRDGYYRGCAVGVDPESEGAMWPLGIFLGLAVSVVARRRSAR